MENQACHYQIGRTYSLSRRACLQWSASAGLCSCKSGDTRGYISETLEALVKIDDRVDEAEESAEQVAEPERVEALFRCMLMRLDQISTELMAMQVVGVIQLARQHDADEEVANLLAGWRLRSPITRGE